MKCPTCGCEKFYVKDVADEYEIYEFTTSGKDIISDESIDPQEIPKITPKIETFCDRCAWHGEFSTLSN